jgi:hypothetical protein
MSTRGHSSTGFIDSETPARTRSHRWWATFSTSHQRVRSQANMPYKGNFSQVAVIACLNIRLNSEKNQKNPILTRNYWVDAKSLLNEQRQLYLRETRHSSPHRRPKKNFLIFNLYRAKQKVYSNHIQIRNTRPFGFVYEKYELRHHMKTYF